MNQAATIQFKSTVSPRKRGSAGKFFIGLLVAFAIAFAGFLGWRHFHPLKRGNAPTTTSRTAPAAVKPASATVSPKVEDRQPATSSVATKVKATVIGLADTVVEAIAPSAKTKPIQHEAPPAPKPVANVLPAKRITLQAAAAAAPVHPPQPLTAAQKRLQIAQKGFDHIMDVAARNPGAYGFISEESLGNATLGKEIPVYTIALQGRDKFASQSVDSLLKPADEWLYPVVSGNKIYYMVKVKYDGHDYVLETGSRALGATYNKILAQWPEDKGFHPKLITVSGLPAYYFTIPELPEQNITDTDRMFDYNPEISPASIVLANCQ